MDDSTDTDSDAASGEVGGESADDTPLPGPSGVGSKVKAVPDAIVAGLMKLEKPEHWWLDPIPGQAYTTFICTLGFDDCKYVEHIWLDDEYEEFPEAVVKTEPIDEEMPMDACGEESFHNNESNEMGSSLSKVTGHVEENGEKEMCESISSKEIEMDTEPVSDEEEEDVLRRPQENGGISEDSSDVATAGVDITAKKSDSNTNQSSSSAECISKENGDCDNGSSEMEVDQPSDIVVEKEVESAVIPHSKADDNSVEKELLQVSQTVEPSSDCNLALSDKENQITTEQSPEANGQNSESSKILEKKDSKETDSEMGKECSDAKIDSLPTKECDNDKITEKDEKMDVDKSAEKDDKRDETKEKEKGDDTDSDDDRPQIFLRNFAEITERDSDDDDDDVQEISVLEPEPVSKNLKTYSKKDKVASRLSEISTYDDQNASLEMSAEDDSNNNQQTIKAKDRKLVKGCTRLAMWLRHQATAANKPDTRSNVGSASNRAGAPESSRPTTRMTSNSSRDSNAAVLNSMLQSVQQTYPMPPMSASQLVYGRGASNPTRLPRQPVPPLSLISTSSSFAPGTTLIAQPMNGLWQSQNPQGIQRPNAPHGQMRNSTTVTSVTSVPRPSTAGNNVQSPFTQLIFDPATGYLLCPTNQNCQVISQQSNPVQQQLVGSPSNTVRIQNGMILRPNDSSYNNNSTRQVIAGRNGLEISLSSVPQVGNTQQRMQLQQPRAPANTIRSFAPPVQNPRQQVSSRFIRPQQNAVNSPVMHQSVMASQLVQQQQRMRTPVPPPAPRAALPSRYPPMRPSSPQIRPPVIRAPSPLSQRPNAAPQRVNGIPIPVPIPTKPGQSSSTAPADAGSVTAGNQKPIPGTVEDADADLQNKTFPSLVVQVKTCLSVKPNRQSVTKSRAELDAGVKAVLIHSPAKFTEWLMRRGLLKLAHCCELHANQSFKLGMYSDSSRQPFSGGYVWTSECCPERQISVFNGSIFEGSKYPPGTVLKLMYHWACQTPANNILQWVKVSSLYLKNFFTLLRAVCISWMHEQCPPMGGEAKYVEIGVITLGSSAETSRGVKNVNVEILGVFDPATKIIRMKVINSMQAQLFKDKNKGGKPDASEQGARAFQILWPLTHWVDKRSVLLVDGIIDRALFQELGFKNIQQCNDGQRSHASNTNVMNYLRNLVPKMFSSTLSVLSKSIVQQFLDELSWREMYGNTVLSSFENLLDHIGTMTKWDLRGESLISRLNKINQNPFVDWSYTKQTRRCPLNTVPLSLRNEPGIRECVKYVMKDEKKQPPPPPVYTSSPPPATAPPASSYLAPQKAAQKRKTLDPKDVVANLSYYREIYETSPKVHSLQAYYYGSVKADENVSSQSLRFPANLKCPMCIRTFTSNIEVCRHIYTHISSVTYRGSENSVCRICLKELPMGVSMQQHIQVAHTMVGFATACRICEEKFKSEQELVIHMWDLHQRRETPYKCLLCNYASSFHYFAVQHHQEKHANEADAVCPFCLKIFSCASVAHLKQLINHLQAHAQLQRRVKKCPRCVLTFVNDLDLEAHLQEHRSQEPSAKWIPYLLPLNETNVKMAAPPPSKTPLHVSMMAISAAAMANSAPPAKKQKMNQYPAKKKQSTLNATLAVPIDTNEKFGGSKYRINIPAGSSGMCAECGNDINKPNHFIGRLSCTKCRYNTACQAAMDLHHERNHKPGSKSIKPGIKTKSVKLLEEPMICKCGFSSTHPHQLANHLVSCDRMTVYPKPSLTPNPVAVTAAVDVLTKAPNAQQPSALPDTSLPMAQLPLSPTLGLLGREPAVTFEDMLSLEESMANTLEALALPPLLSPSAPMPQSPLAFEASGSSTNNQSQPAPTANTEASNSWDPDTWELPLSGLIAKCKQK